MGSYIGSLRLPHCLQTRGRNADGLSRLPLLMEALQGSPVTACHIKQWTEGDPVLAKVRKQVLQGWSNRIPPQGCVQQSCLWGAIPALILICCTQQLTLESGKSRSGRKPSTTFMLRIDPGRRGLSSMSRISHPDQGGCQGRFLLLQDRPVSYRVMLPDCREFRRHADHIRTRTIQDSTMSNDEDDDDWELPSLYPTCVDRPDRSWPVPLLIVLTPLLIKGGILNSLNFELWTLSFYIGHTPHD